MRNRWLPRCLAAFGVLTLLPGCPEIEGLSTPVSPTVVTGSGATPVPAGEALPPLDLSNQPWVSDQPNKVAFADNTLTFQGDHDDHLTVYQPPLGPDFSLSFHAIAQGLNGEYRFRWMYDTVDRTKNDATGKPLPTAECELYLDPNGNAKVTLDPDHTSTVQFKQDKLTGPHDWTLGVKAGHAFVTLDGQSVADFALPTGYHPVPWLHLWSWNTKESLATIDHVTVNAGSPAEPHMVVRQWSLEGKPGVPPRFTLMLPSDLPQRPSDAEINTLPAILPHVAAVAGTPIQRTSALVIARSDGGGGTHAWRWIHLSPDKLKACPVSAHEMSHDLGQGGSRKKRSPDGFLVEGMADFLCYEAYNHYLGQPIWKTPPIGTLPAYDPPLSHSADDPEAKATEGLSGWRDYTKGRIFLSVLAAYTSPEDVGAVIASNQDASEVTGAMFLKKLETRTGKDLSFLVPGWLEPGAYKAVSPADANDTNGDGVLDFQEKIGGKTADKAGRPQPDLEPTAGFAD